MNTYHLLISTPDGNVFDGETVSLSVRGVEGDLAVLAGHIPFVTSIQPCACKVVAADGSERLGRAEGGLLTVSADRVTLLASSFRWES